MSKAAFSKECELADEQEIWELRYNAALGIRYHMARQSFYRRLQRLISGLSLAFSTAAVALLFENTLAGQILASIVASLQVIDLVIDTRGSSQLHNNLRRDYLRLERELTQRVNPLTLNHLQKISDKLTSIETEEPPIKRWLLESCRLDVNAFLKVEASKQNITLRWYKNLLRHLY